MRSAGAIILIAVRRILKQAGLNILVLIGVIAGIAFCTSIPLYSNTIYNRLLQTELYDKRRSMPAFGLLFRYKGVEEKQLSWDDIQPVSDYLTYHTAPALGLPQKLSTRYVVSPLFDIYAPDQLTIEKRFALTEMSFGTQSDLEEHITMIEKTDTPSSGNALDVIISESTQLINGWSTGQSVLAVLEQKTALGLNVYKIPVRITGVWRRTNPDEPYWFFNPMGLLEDSFLMSEQIYAQDFAPLLDDEVSNAMWYLILDGDAFLPNQAEGFLRRLNTVTIRAGTLLQNTELMVAPAANALREYQAAARWLTVTLFAFSVPVLIVIAIFLGMVVRLVIRHQGAEIAVLRSRGATEEQTLGIAAIQGILIGIVALAAGLPLGRQFALQMARAKGFLNFSGLIGIQLLETPTNLQIGLGVVCGLLIGMVVTTGGLLKNTIVRYHQDVGRASQKSWWQKTGLDLVVLVVAVYGVIQLRQQGPLPGLEEMTAEEAIKQNPLLYMVPALCTISLTLVALRVLPLVSAIVAKGLTHTNRVAALLAVRQVARHPAGYTAPILLMVLTLSLAVFTSSLAITLRRHENTIAYQDIGADLRLLEYGESTEIEIQLEIEKLCLDDPELPCPWENETAAEVWIQEMQLRERPRWRFLPIGDHLQVNGVQAVSPVGRYAVEPLSREIGATGVFLGIDRSTFIDVAYWEPHYADESLGVLMNSLAVASDGVLISSDLRELWSLNIGDSVPVKISIAEPGTVGAFQTVDLRLKVAGFFKQFPSWSPETGPLLVGNLDYLFQEAGGQFPHHVWINTAAGADPVTIFKTVRDLGFKVQTWDAPQVRVEKALARPEFQGLMGILSTGFVISAFLTVFGMLLYLFFSFKRRSIEVGALRAIGLAKSQVTALMVWELVILMLLGSLGGTAIGVGISSGLIPYMQVGALEVARVSVPVAVVIAWNHVLLIYGLFAVLFLIMVIILISALNRVRLYAVLKLGDTM